MKVISVAGATSKAGKTLLAEQLIRYCSAKYSPVYGVKFTTTSDLPSPCPRGAPCNVCDLSDRFRIIRDSAILQQPGKNTQRLLAANATEVIWVVSKRKCLPEALRHLQQHIPDNAIVVMEGSTITRILKPHLLFYVFANHIAPSRWKESAAELLQEADFLVVNRKTKWKDHPDIQMPPRARIIDLMQQDLTGIDEIRSKIDTLIEIS